MFQLTSADKEIEPGDIFYLKKGFEYRRILMCNGYTLVFHKVVIKNPNFDLENITYKSNLSEEYLPSYPLQKFKDEKYPWLTNIELSEAEQKMFRPDLPLFFGRSKLLSWKKISELSSYEDLLEYDEEFEKKLSFEDFFIQTYGAKGGGKKVIRISSGGKKSMSTAQIIWKCAQYQAEAFQDTRYGVGIFRKGRVKDVPLCYLWGYYDRSNHILHSKYGTTHSTHATLGNREQSLIGWQEYLKKKQLDKKTFKITIDKGKFPVEGSVLKLFLKWHSEPVKSFKLSFNEFILDLSDYPPGPYYMLLSNSEKDVYTYWGEYHLIRDDHDGWVYIYPDMKNITQYSKKIEEPKKIVIPKIRSNASMKKYEKKLKELLAAGKIQGRGEIMDIEEHGFQLHYFDLNEADSHFDALSEQGFQGGGPTWYGIVSGAIQLAEPTLNDKIYIDDDSEGIIISSKSKAVLEKMSRLIGILKSEPELLAASIHIAEKNEMID